MIQVEYKFKLGTDEFTIKAEVKSQTEFFEAIGFYANLPKVGPNGETDLKLTYRKVREYEYYSIVSVEAGQEFRFGQYKAGDGMLFDKGWEPLYQKDGEQREETSGQASGGSRFQKSEKTEKTDSKPTSRFNKPAAKQAEPQEESEEVSQEEVAESEAEEQEQEAAQKPAPKQESKQTSAPAGKSKMADLMAKYGGAKTGASTSSMRR